MSVPVSVGPATAGRDWRETLALAADLALLGIVLTLAALPVLTAGSAVGTASGALHRRLHTGTWPSAGELARRFGRGLLPGVPVTLLALGVSVLLAADLAALATGAVPGGPLLIGLTCAVALTVAGWAGLVVVEVGRADQPVPGWRAAARQAAYAVRGRPALLAAGAGVLAVAGLIGVLITPVAVPILAGYTIAALHAVRGRPSPGAEGGDGDTVIR